MMKLTWVTGEEPEFRNRTIIYREIQSMTKAGTILGRDMVVEGVFMCDICPDTIGERPFVIVGGSHALCLFCRLKWGIKPGDTEWEDTHAKL